MLINKPLNLWLLELYVAALAYGSIKVSHFSVHQRGQKSAKYRRMECFRIISSSIKARNISIC